MTKTTPRPAFFEFESESAEFQRSIAQTLHELNQKIVHNRIPQENTQHFTHGRTWVHTANEQIGAGEMQTFSAEMDVKFEDIIDNNLDTIPNSLNKATEAFQRQFTQALYAMISATCEKSGNVVSAKAAGSFPNTFMEVLKKIEFGVDRDGNVSLPELHVGHDPQKLLDELEAQPPEFHAEIERIKAQKINEALEREHIRKNRFKRQT